MQCMFALGRFMFAPGKGLLALSNCMFACLHLSRHLSGSQRADLGFIYASDTLVGYICCIAGIAFSLVLFDCVLYNFFWQLQTLYSTYS